MSLMKEVSLELGNDYSFMIQNEGYNSLLVTITHKESQYTQQSTLPCDHHLNDDRILNLVRWSKQQIEEKNHAKNL